MEHLNKLDLSDLTISECGDLHENSCWEPYKSFFFLQDNSQQKVGSNKQDKVMWKFHQPKMSEQ